MFLSSEKSGLITSERSQKLDLLTHLISMRRQSLVVCGEKGIGKTTLLNELDARRVADFVIVKASVSAKLSFVKIQNQLQSTIEQHDRVYENQELSLNLSRLNSQNQKVVLLFDNAGLLVTGLIDALIKYAEQNACLRVVFALTDDEVQIKNESDKTIDKCHFIEIPPLTKNQCNIFLQNMAVKPNAIISSSVINDDFIDYVFEETEGVPGKVMALLDGLVDQKVRRGIRLSVLLMFIMAVMIGISQFFTSKNETNQTKQNTKILTIKKKPEIIETLAIPLMSEDHAKTKTVDEDEKGSKKIKGDFFTIKPFTIDNVVTEKPDLLQQPVELLKEVVELPPKEDSKVSDVDNEEIVDIIGRVKINKSESIVEKNEGNGNQWLLEQPNKYYTVQLIILSTDKALSNFSAKNSILQKNLKVVQINEQEQKKYILLHGVYKSKAIALKEMQLLPVKYRKSWIRQFRDLQKAIR